MSDGVTPLTGGDGKLGYPARQPAPNVDGIGSWIEVKVGNRVVQREVTVGGGHVGGQAGLDPLGAGDANSVEARVQWPDGETGRWLNVNTNQLTIIERGADRAVTWDPSR